MAVLRSAPPLPASAALCALLALGGLAQESPVASCAAGADGSGAVEAGKVLLQQHSRASEALFEGEVGEGMIASDIELEAVRATAGLKAGAAGALGAPGARSRFAKATTAAPKSTAKSTTSTAKATTAAPKSTAKSTTTTAKATTAASSTTTTSPTTTVQTTTLPPEGSVAWQNVLGPLGSLLGTWEGASGVNMVFVPAADSSAQKFAKLIQNKYTEQITFAPIQGGVLNRGLMNPQTEDPQPQMDQLLMGVTYYSQVHELLEGGRVGELIHVENGQLLWNRIPGTDANWSISRMALIPHGVALVALGSDKKLSGDQILADIQGSSAQFDHHPTNVGGGLLGYFGGRIPSVVDSLVASLGDIFANGPMESMTAIKLSMKTANGMTTLPSVSKQVPHSDFAATFWVQKNNDLAGNAYEQLQYAQTVLMSFSLPGCGGSFGAPMEDLCVRPPGLIGWPHVQSNTLRKTRPFTGFP